MDRRDFLKTSGAAVAGWALTGCAAKKVEKTSGHEALASVPFIPEVVRSAITRDIKPLPPLNVKNIHLKVGARRPFAVMHVSDTHIVRVDNRDDEAKTKLASRRARSMAWGEHYLDEAIAYACNHGMHMMHTGDLYDFVSEANLDTCAQHMLMADWFVCAGNHEYSKYVGEAKEDEAYKADSREAVSSAYPNDLTFASRVIEGVNFVAVDDVYYYFTEHQHALMEAEMKKGLPVVMLCHVPLYTPEALAYELKATKGSCGYLTGVPEEITSKYDPGVTYPEGQEWRYRKVQQHADKPTLDFIAWLKEQQLLKAILCGHCHRFFEERFSPTAMQYAVDATYHGGAQAVFFE